MVWAMPVDWLKKSKTACRPIMPSVMACPGGCIGGGQPFHKGQDGGAAQTVGGSLSGGSQQDASQEP